MLSIEIVLAMLLAVVVSGYVARTIPASVALPLPLVQIALGAVDMVGRLVAVARDVLDHGSAAAELPLARLDVESKAEAILPTGAGREDVRAGAARAGRRSGHQPAARAYGRGGARENAPPPEAPAPRRFPLHNPRRSRPPLPLWQTPPHHHHPPRPAHPRPRTSTLAPPPSALRRPPSRTAPFPPNGIC